MSCNYQETLQLDCGVERAAKAATGDGSNTFITYILSGTIIISTLTTSLCIWEMVFFLCCLVMG